jgi:oligopeptide/dipeptide ABC transporter ATP-binding protein
MTAAAVTPSIEVSGLNVSLLTPAKGEVRLVDDVSFAVRPGAMTAIVGESGAGKSLTTKAILGLLDDRRFRVGGQVSLGGVDLSGMTARQRRAHVARTASLVFQNPTRALNPTMRVGPQIIESITKVRGAERTSTGRVSGAQARERGLELMRAVGIPDPKERFYSYPHQLSGGMRQRIVIAIALAADPKVIICDEPTSSLDVTTQALIMDLFDQLRAERGISFLLVTHDLALASSRVDDVVVLYAGRVVEANSADRIFRDAAMPYTRDLVAAIPDPADPAALWEERPARRAAPVPGGGCSYVANCALAEQRCRDEVPSLLPLDSTGPHDNHLCRCWFPVVPSDSHGPLSAAAEQGGS